MSALAHLVLQAPMYYRGASHSPPQPCLFLLFPGANAALLLYDITNASSFDDVRSWLLGPCIPLRPSVLTSPRTQEKL